MDKNRQQIGYVDNFTSLVWADRYNQLGDFTLDVSPTYENLNLFQEDYYVRLADGDIRRPMVIEKLTIANDIEKGPTLTVKGSSLEHILERRIVWGLCSIEGDFQNGIKKVLNENAISPTDKTRKLPITFVASTDSYITGLTIDTQFTGDSLYTAISSCCQSADVGCRVLMTDYSTGAMTFELYTGVDRSYSQTAVAHVIFSPNFDNLLNSSYYTDKTTLATVTLVGGEGEGSDRKYVTVAADGGALSGIDRREVFTDARNVSSNTANGTTLTATQYKAQLTQKGKETLADSVKTQLFDGEAEPRNSFLYGRDYTIGDIVQIENEYGMAMTVRVSEFIQSEDSQDGYKSYPTFASVATV